MPSIEVDKKALNYAADNIDSPDQAKRQKAGAALQVLGLTDVHAKAWREAKKIKAQNPDDPRASKVRNVIFGAMAKARPSEDPGFFGGVSIPRLVAKNLLDQNPQVQEAYFKRLGNETRFVNGNLEIRKPDSTQFEPVDPEGIDAFDAFDIVGDVLEGAAAGVGGLVGATVGAPLGVAAGTAGGPAGMVIGGGAGLLTGGLLGAGATTALFEKGRQRVSQAVGAREELDPSAIAQAGLLGAGGELLGGGAGVLLRGLGKGVGKIVSKFSAGLKKSAPEIEAAAKELGATATPGQLSESRILQELESAQAQSGGMIGGIGVRKQVEKNRQAVQDVADGIVSEASERSSFEVGDQAGKQISESLASKLEPAEALYTKYETLFRRKAYKPNIDPIKNKIDEIKNQLKFDKAGLAKLNTFEEQLDGIANLDDLKKFRTAIGNELARDPLNKTNRQILGQLYEPITKARSETLIELARRSTEARELAKKAAKQPAFSKQTTTDEGFPRFLFHQTTKDIGKKIKTEGVSPESVTGFSKFSDEGYSPKAFFSDEPNDVGGFTIMAVANKLGKATDEVTEADIKKHGFLSVTDVEDDTFSQFYKKVDEDTFLTHEGYEISFQELADELDATIPELANIEPGDVVGSLGASGKHFLEGQKLVDYIKANSDNALVEDIFGPLSKRKPKVPRAPRGSGPGFFKKAKKEIELADKIYKESIDEVATILKRPGQKTAIKGAPKTALKDFLEKTPEIARINKVLNTNDPRKIAAVKKAFPEAFETLRQGKIAELAKGATIGANVNPLKLAKKIEAMPRESANLIFGPNAVKKAAALKLFLQEIPKPVGPSGTPRGMEVFRLRYIIDNLNSLRRDFSLNIRAKAARGDNILTKLGTWFKESATPTAATVITGTQTLFDRPVDQSPNSGLVPRVQPQTPILGR